MNDRRDKTMHTTHEDLYRRVTNQIIEAIEQGGKSFRMPWHRSAADCILPTNAHTQRAYRGVNILALWSAAVHRGYKSGLWATYQQWAQLGAHVRRGEKATLVVLWKLTENRGKETDDREEHERRKPGVFARGYWVFNAAQVDGYQAPEFPKLPESERLQNAEEFFGRLGAEIRHGGSSASYVPSLDLIHMPEFSDFRTAGGYYSTLAHEITLWTGAAHRTNRQLDTCFKSDAYAVEELIAELGSAFLCAILQIEVEPRSDHAAYIADWLRVLRRDRKAVFLAASQAQGAVDWLRKQAGAKSDSAVLAAASL
jgi:antirestriction protein ArdC